MISSRRRSIACCAKVRESRNDGTAIVQKVISQVFKTSRLTGKAKSAIVAAVTSQQRLQRRLPKRAGRFVNLRAWRDAYQLGQVEAAKQLGISQSMVSKFERGVYVPKAKLAKRIADRTGVSLESVLGLS